MRLRVFTFHDMRPFGLALFLINTGVVVDAILPFSMARLESSRGPVVYSNSGYYSTVLKLGGIKFSIIGILASFGIGLFDVLFRSSAHLPLIVSIIRAYLTRLCLSGIKLCIIEFGIINIVRNWYALCCSCYWQAATDARPARTHKGHILGGFTCWFVFLFALATSFSLC